MISRMVAAAARAFLVALVIALPTLVLPTSNADTGQMVALLSLLAAMLTFVEYVSEYPSLVEFRDAAPYNRTRFAVLFMTVFSLTLISPAAAQSLELGQTLSGIAAQLGTMLDFPFSPVRLMSLLATDGASLDEIAAIRSAAGLALVLALSLLVAFSVLVRSFDWPIRRGAFNFWVNLPLFDPTTGGDVLRRLKRDASVNFALGFLLPFLIPAVLKAAGTWSLQVNMADPQTLIWVVSAWAFLPGSMIIRGMALLRIADLIEEKRRRAYRQADLQAA